MSLLRAGTLLRPSWTIGSPTLAPSGDVTGATDDANFIQALESLPNGGIIYLDGNPADPFYTRQGWAPPANVPAGTIIATVMVGSTLVTGLTGGSMAVPATGSVVYVYGFGVPAGTTLTVTGSGTTGVLSNAVLGPGGNIGLAVGGMDPTVGNPVCIQGIGKPTLRPIGQATGVWYHRTVDYGVAENGVEAGNPPVGFIRDLVIDGSLSTTSTEFNKVNNPSFEYDASGATPADWPASTNVGSSTLVTWQAQAEDDITGTGWSASGGQSARMTVTVSTGGGYTENTATGTGGIPVTAGSVWQAQAVPNVLELATGALAKLQVQWFNSAGTALTTVPVGSTNALGVTQLAGTVVAPATAAFASVQIGFAASTGPGTDDAYFDAVMFSQSSKVLPYADGDSADWSWSGTPGDSSSTGTAGGLGIDVGDGDGLDIDVTVENFSANNALGAYINNQVTYTTRSRFRIHGYRNDTQIYVDVAGGVASFSDNEFDLFLRANTDQNGVVLDSAQLTDCELKIRGTLPASSATGSVPTGNCAMLSVVNGGQVYRSRIDANVTADTTGAGAGNLWPYTIYSDGTGSIQQCTGEIVTDLSGAFMNNAECSFSGPYNWNDALPWPSVVFPGYGVPWLNTGPDALVYVTGTGITSIVTNLSTTGATSGLFLVGAAGSITVNAPVGTANPTWTVSPTRMITEGSTVPSAPGQVTGVTAVAGSGQATVSWTAPTSGGAPTSYTVTPYISGTPQTSVLVTGTPPPRTTIVSGLTPSTAYTFTVHASNAAGSGTESTASSAVTPTGATAPGAPTAVQATDGDNAQSTVSWTAPTSNGGSSITSYTITPFIGGTAQSTTVVTGSPPATSKTVTGLTNGTAYTFEVEATNAIGTSAQSGASVAITPSATTSTNPIVIGATVNTPAGTYASAGGAAQWNEAVAFDADIFTGSAYPTTTPVAQRVQKMYFADGELYSNVSGTGGSDGAGKYQDGNFNNWETFVLTHGGRLLISLRPQSISNGGYQDTLFTNMVAALVTHYKVGNFKIVLYQECNGSGHAGVFPFNPPTGKSNGAAYIAYAKHYIPMIWAATGRTLATGYRHGVDIPVVFDPIVGSGAASESDAAGFYPGDDYVDEIYVDYYSSAYYYGVGLRVLELKANNHSASGATRVGAIPFGVGEWGYRVHPMPGEEGTLSSGLSTGSPVTSLPVNAWSGNIGSGKFITVRNIAKTQSQAFTTSGTVSPGATSIPVVSKTPNFAYPSGSQVSTWSPNLWSSYNSYLISGVGGPSYTYEPTNSTRAGINDGFTGFANRRGKFPNGWFLWWAGNSGGPGVADNWPTLGTPTPDPRLSDILRVYTALTQ